MAIRFNSKEEYDYAIRFWGIALLLFLVIGLIAFLSEYLDGLIGINGDTWQIIIYCFIGIIIMNNLYRKGKLNKILQIFKKSKNIEHDNGLNIIYSNNERGYLYQIFERENGMKHGLLHSYNDIGELHYSQVWRNGKYGGPRYRKSITKRVSEILKLVDQRGGPMKPEELEEINSINEKVNFYRSKKEIYSEEKKAAFDEEKNSLMKLHQKEYPSIEDKKGTAWEK